MCAYRLSSIMTLTQSVYHACKALNQIPKTGVWPLLSFTMDLMPLQPLQFSFLIASSWVHAFGIFTITQRRV